MLSHLSAQVINYCERHDLSFWSEPVNAITNFGFFAVAWYMHSLARANLPGGAQRKRVNILTVLLVCIGTGSFLFHTFASNWAMILDLLPIALFIFYYLRVLLLDVFDMPHRRVVAMCAIYVAVSFVCSAYIPNDISNGSSGYVAALVLFSAVVIACYQTGKPCADNMLMGCLLFWTSLFLRTMDRKWCVDFPLGTHFMWHLINAAVLCFLMRFLVFNLARKR